MNKHIKVLNTLKSNVDMIKYCDKNLVKLGTGSSRHVYAISDKLVVKVAKGKIGVKQNENEIRVWNLIDYTFEYYKRSFAKIDVNQCHWMDLFIVMERLDLDNNPYKRKFGFKTFKLFRTGKHKEIDSKVLQIMKHVSVIDDTAFTNNMSELQGRNMGISNSGILKLCDYGFCNHTFNMMQKVNQKTYIHVKV